MSLFRFALLGFATGIFYLGNLCVTLSSAADQEPEDRRYYKMAPLTGELVPVAEKELFEGDIYSHFSSTLNRRVWSFYLGNGRFWDAFGPGTTQAARRFDRTLARRDPLQPLPDSVKAKVPELNLRTDRAVYFRLAADNTWKIAGNTSLPNVFSLETGYRFEQHFRDRYTPVSHVSGYQWEYVNGEYEPVGQ